LHAQLKSVREKERQAMAMFIGSESRQLQGVSCMDIASRINPRHRVWIN
jgi:hypothetical protein